MEQILRNRTLYNETYQLYYEKTQLPGVSTVFVKVQFMSNLSCADSKHVSLSNFRMFYMK